MNINTRVNFMFPSGKNLVYNNFVMIKDKYMKKIQMTLITALTFLMMCSASWAATYYIDGTNGNDAKSGFQSTPWKTIGKANSTLRAGDTVYIKKGTYKETIRPKNTGQKGNSITYSKFGPGEVIISNVSIAVDLHDRSYIVIDGLTIKNTNNYWFDMEENANYCVIKNCYMETDRGRGIFMRASHYNKIQNNTLRGLCKPSDLISMRRCTYNLIEGNDLSHAAHLTITINGKEGDTGHNIVRNNIIRNPWHAVLSVYRNATPTLIENNYILDGGSDYRNNTCGSDRDRNMAPRDHKGIQIGSPNLIIRNNISVNNGRGIGLSTSEPNKHSQNLRVYNNVFYDNIWGIGCNSSGEVSGNIFKNNISYNNDDYDVRLGGGSSRQNYLINNNFGNKLYNDNNTWEKNISLDPKLINRQSRNFNNFGSPLLIDAGVFLTKTTNNSSGSTLKVEDARYFMDGWGIISGDVIQLEGQTQTAMIISVDYDNNTIKVDKTLSWGKGIGVSLAYKGLKPDLGAFEHGDVDMMLAAPKNLRIANIQ
jgi:parallel beta-helix repeat protein